MITIEQLFDLARRRCEAAEVFAVQAADGSYCSVVDVNHLTREGVK